MTPLLSRMAPLAMLGRRPAQPPRVAHLVDSLESGAVASLVEAACMRLPALQIPSFCVCLDTPGARFAAQLPEGALLSLAVRDQPVHRRIAALAAALQQLRVDILHTHGTALAEGLAAALLGRVPALVHDQLGAAIGADRRALRVARRLACRFLASSAQAAASLGERAGLDPARIYKLPPSVDTERFRPELDGQTTRQRLGLGNGLLVGSVGTLRPSRSYGVLVEAVALMRGQGVDVHCLLVGDGPHVPRLNNQASELGIADRVHLHGFSKEVPSLLAAMDIFVLPSRSDDVPQSLLEAMAVGLPVIAGSGGPAAEVLRDGDNGLLVPPDHAAVLARILAQLGQSETRRRALGERARAAVLQRHGQGLAVEALARLYRDIVR